MHVLRNVHQALRPSGLLLDVHPTGDDAPIRAGGRGLGFVGGARFDRIVAATDAAVDEAVAAGLFEDVRRLEREVVDRYDDPGELLETAEEWSNLRLPAAARRRVRAATPPVDVLWHVVFRLLKKRPGGSAGAAAQASGSTGSPTRIRPGSSTSP